MTANPLLGEVALPPLDVAGFEAGGVLLLDFNALCSLEDAVKQEIDQIGTAVLESPSMLRTVMAIALEDHHGGIDPRVAGKIIQRLGHDKAAELILKAFTLSFPEAAATGASGPRMGAATAGTGGAASRSGSKSASARKASGGKPRVSSRR